MIEGPYSSINLAVDARFMHLTPSYISTCTSSSSSSSSASSYSPRSPSSTSPSSFADSPSALSKSSVLGDRQPYSTSSSNLSFYSSPRTDVSGASSATSIDLTSPCNTFPAEWNDYSYNFSTKSSWPARSENEISSKHATNLQRQACLVQALPKEQLQNPRRTKRLLEPPSSCNEAQTCPLPPPTLVRQADRKVNFVDNLVDTAAQIVEAIWPSMLYKSCEPSLGRVLPLRTFIQETLRRSRTSYSTLQVALYYLFVVRPFVPTDEMASAASDRGHDVRALQCGRRMFLAALILASKYLQDRNYSARAWSKISGLNISEINANELAFLTAVNWRLHISDCIFEKWTKIVLKCTPTTSVIPANPSVQSRFATNKWVAILERLDMNLDASVLDEILNDVENSSLVSNAPSAIAPDHSAIARRSSFGTGSKLSSMALALGNPCAQSMPMENMPQRCSQTNEERNANRAIRKSSLSVCENVDACEMEGVRLSKLAGSVASNVPSSARSVKANNYASDKSTVVVDSRHRIHNVNKPFPPVDVPVREQILGQPSGRPESKRLPPSSSIINIQEGSGKTRKRGNETPVAARHQKKQKDKLGESASQKQSEIAPSGLTPQMRQMSTNFSVSGKKGNGLRMNIIPGRVPVYNMPHGQNMRPSAGSSSMGHVVYG